MTKPKKDHPWRRNAQAGRDAELRRIDREALRQTELELKIQETYAQQAIRRFRKQRRGGSLFP